MNADKLLWDYGNFSQSPCKCKFSHTDQNMSYVQLKITIPTEWSKKC